MLGQCREAEEKQLNNRFDNERVRASKVSLLLERNLERQARDYRKKVAQENMLLAQDQKAFQKHLNEEVSNYFTEFLCSHHCLYYCNA